MIPFRFGLNQQISSLDYFVLNLMKLRPCQLDPITARFWEGSTSPFFPQVDAENPQISNESVSADEVRAELLKVNGPFVLKGFLGRHFIDSARLEFHRPPRPHDIRTVENPKFFVCSTICGRSFLPRVHHLDDKPMKHSPYQEEPDLPLREWLRVHKLKIRLSWIE
jgi:hypothetical protein